MKTINLFLYIFGIVVVNLTILTLIVSFTKSVQLSIFLIAIQTVICITTMTIVAVKYFLSNIMRE